MKFNMYVPFVFGAGRPGEPHRRKPPGEKAMSAISNGKSCGVKFARNNSRGFIAAPGAGVKPGIDKRPAPGGFLL
jgi:hypothetical protein